MDKFTYKKIGDSVLSIDLQNNYSIIAIYKKNNNKYDVKFYIKENSIEMLILVDELDDISFNANPGTINSAILKFVSTSASNNLFDSSIDYYDYTTNYFDRGNSLFEKENKNK